MARKPPDEDDTLELTPDMEAEADEGEAEFEGEEGEEDAEEGEEEEAEGEGEGETEIGFGDDEAPAEGDNRVIRALRERNRELTRQVQEIQRAQPAETQLPEKPTLADCDYDEEVFEAALTGWHEQKRQVESARENNAREAEAAQREWQRDLESYEARRTALALPDFEDSAEAVKSVLNLAQQAVIIKAASDSGAFVYALGRSDTKLAELAKIQDPIKLAAAVARMEGGIKVVKKRRAPAPDRPVKGSARLPGSGDKQLEKLEEEAGRTGDRTAVIAYKKRLERRNRDSRRK